MKIDKYLNNDQFSDVKTADDFYARPGTYTPYELTIMYPSGILP